MESNHKRREAEQVVSKIRGVVGVRNAITVTPRAHPAEVKRRVTRALERSAELDARPIEVSADGSTVTLHGHFYSLRQRRAANEAAWAPGVSHVHSRLGVRP